MRLPPLLSLAVAARSVGAPAAAQIYAGQTPGGGVVLSNFPGPATPTLMIESEPRAGAASPAAVPVAARPAAPPSLAPAALSAIVRDVAREVDMPAPLLHAVIAVESAYEVRAVSPKGAQGLMQLMPATAQRFGVADAFDPRDNVRGGARYLKWLLERFSGDLQLALAGYNASVNAVIRAGYRIPPHAGTQRYAPSVLARM